MCEFRKHGRKWIIRDRQEHKQRKGGDWMIKREKKNIFFKVFTFFPLFIMTTLSSAESFPKRLRSASARLFSMNTTPQPINKRSSCYFNTDNVLTSSPNTSYSVFNPSTWFPRIRQRSTSSSSSTFSLVYTPTTPEHFTPNHYISCSSSIESISIELEELFNNAKIEVKTKHSFW